MKRGGELSRSTPLERRTPLTSSPLPRSSLGRNAGPKLPAKPKRPRDTGPSQRVRNLVAERSQGWCEWPVCVQRATDVHHRLNRKQGGRHGKMADRINQPAWLLHACRDHHAVVTSPVGEARLQALAMGWVLLEGHDAVRIPAVTRHGRVWLTNDGRFIWSPSTASPTTTAQEG